ncbi:hypothetical protein DM01DRAFT_1404544 [Hesseltinella vesiculosa]|uniref:Cytochrome b mRNA-processing protein 4 n=1 Tax=Hesseltinella vesiculosa TaxID=101127 RepID=A0A1X2GRY7_9FUNG|nr:hypothetical protein DM01DRAFT_1404544 [Hesseltinella vesiculosa]
MAKNVGRVLLLAGSILATGVVLMKVTVPDENEMRKRLDPTLLKEADRMKAQHKERTQQLLDQMRQVAESDKPMWGDKK